MVSKTINKAPALSPKDAALALRVSQDTLRRWRSAGTGPRFSRIGREIRYAGVEIRKWSKRRGAASALCFLLGLMVCACNLSAQDPSVMQGPATMIGPLNYCGSDSGSGNAYVCQNTSVSARQVKTLYAGNRYRFKATHANTGAATLAMDGLSTTTIKKMVSGSLTDLAAGDIASGQMVDLIYDGTYFQYQPATASGSQKTVTVSQLPGFVAAIGGVAPGSSAIGDTDMFSIVNTAIAGGNVTLVVDAPVALSNKLQLASNTTLACNAGMGFIGMPSNTVAQGMLLTNAHPQGATTSAGSGSGYGPGYLVSNIVDHDIHVQNCILNGNSTQADTVDQTNYATQFGTIISNMLGIQNVYFDNDLFYDPGAYASLMGNAQNVHFTNVTMQYPTQPSTLNKHTDGIHVVGPAQYFYIDKGLFINGGDDQVALNANDGFEATNTAPGTTNGGGSGGGFSWGPINDVFVTDTDYINCASAIRIMSSSSPIDRIFVKNAQGTFLRQALSLENVLGYGSGIYGTVSFDGLNFTRLAHSGSAYATTADINVQGTWQNLSFTNVTVPSATVETWPFLQLDAGGSIVNLTLANWVINNPAGNNSFAPIVTNGAVTNINASNITWVDASNGTETLFSGSTPPTSLTLDEYSGAHTRVLASGYAPASLTGDAFKPIPHPPVDLTGATGTNITWGAEGAAPLSVYSTNGDWLFGPTDYTSLTSYWPGFAGTSTLSTTLSCKPTAPLTSTTTYPRCGVWAVDVTNNLVYFAAVYQYINSSSAGQSVPASLAFQTCPWTAGTSTIGSCTSISGDQAFPVLSTDNLQFKLTVSGGTITASQSDDGFLYWPLWTHSIGTVSHFGVTTAGNQVTVKSLQVF